MTVDGAININATDAEIVQFIKLIMEGNKVIHNSIKKNIGYNGPFNKTRSKHIRINERRIR